MKPLEIIQPLGVQLFVVFNLEDYRSILTYFGILELSALTEDEIAFVHVFTGKNKFNMVVMFDSESSTIGAMGVEELRRVVIHESTHVMQYYTEIIGDKERAHEFEACFMEYIYGVLWNAAVSSHQFPVLGRPTKKKKFR